MQLGSIVLYRVSEDQWRPAMIVQLWDAVTGCANLLVFHDGVNDAAVRTTESKSPVRWVTSILKGTNVGQWSGPFISYDER